MFNNVVKRWIYLLETVHIERNDTIPKPPKQGHLLEETCVYSHLTQLVSHTLVEVAVIYFSFSEFPSALFEISIESFILKR